MASGRSLFPVPFQSLSHFLDPSPLSNLLPSQSAHISHFDQSDVDRSLNPLGSQSLSQHSRSAHLYLERQGLNWSKSWTTPSEIFQKFLFFLLSSWKSETDFVALCCSSFLTGTLLFYWTDKKLCIGSQWANCKFCTDTVIFIPPQPVCSNVLDLSTWAPPSSLLLQLWA